MFSLKVYNSIYSSYIWHIIPRKYILWCECRVRVRGGGNILFTHRLEKAVEACTEIDIQKGTRGLEEEQAGKTLKTSRENKRLRTLVK